MGPFRRRGSQSAVDDGDASRVTAAAGVGRGGQFPRRDGLVAGVFEYVGCLERDGDYTL